MTSPTLTLVTPNEPEGGSDVAELVQIGVAPEDADFIRFAANIAGVDDAAVVARALEPLRRRQTTPSPSKASNQGDVPIYGRYLGDEVRATFTPTTGAVKILNGPLVGQEFAAPSTAATTVVALNPRRLDPTTNGWEFWHLAATGERLDVLRR